MLIERMQVSEGFLDGLDLTFTPGLNVLVGARGVGKTSVLELIRYALRLPHMDARRRTAATQHAEPVLAGGRVMVTYNLDDRRWTVSRAAVDASAPSPVEAPGLWPIMLGQNELEGIGLDALSRLRLIDARAGLDSEKYDSEIQLLASQAQSLTSQVRDVISQREILRQQEIVRAQTADELKAARESEAQFFAQASEDVHALRLRLKDANAKISEERRTADSLRTIAGALTNILGGSSNLEQTLADLTLEIEHPETTISTQAIASIQRQQRDVSDALKRLIDRFQSEATARQMSAAEADDAIRPLRLDLEQFEQGANEAAQLTARLTEQLEQIDANLARVANLEGRLSELRDRRNSIFADIEEGREQVWEIRNKAASELTARFSPRIRVALEHFGDRSAYVSALATALRGSGLQYNQVAEWLSERVSPQELVDSIEAGDPDRLAALGELTSSRVEKLVAHLAGSDGLGPVLTAPINDIARFELLVGRDYKSSEQLSTGQRCSVVLPLLLADEHRTLLLDQPEDHLDNAYLVENTVRSLIHRSATAQTIVATHNANVPVLGDATSVFVLESDGRRGYIKESGHLTDTTIVEAITQLMEGGRDAFARRAAFYEKSRTSR